MTSQAADLDPLARTRPVEHRSESGEDRRRALRNPEIRPVEVVVGPWRLPPVIQIEPEVGVTVTGVGIVGVERHGRDGCAVGKDDDGTVSMQSHLLMGVRFHELKILASTTEDNAERVSYGVGEDSEARLPRGRHTCCT